MKSFTLLIFLTFFPVIYSQTEFSYKLTVLNNQGKPEVNRDVVFIETSTYERIALKTDGSGTLNYKFNHGKEWAMSVGEMRNCAILKTQGGGQSSRKMTYDLAFYKRENEVRPDRRTITFKEIEQKLSPSAKNGTDNSIVIIVLQDQKGGRSAGIDVALTCFETKTRYKTKSNASGEAVFQVPLSNKYDMDIDGIESINWVDLDNRPTIMTHTILFQKKTFTETEKDGYITQNIPPNTQPSSSHAQVKLKVLGGKKNGIKEDVYLRMLKSNRVYKAKTDDNGDVTFMLPVKGKYMLDFNYQRDADVIDLSQVKGIGFQNKSVYYAPDPRLENIENFIPTLSNLILYDVQNFVNEQYPEPEKDMDIYLKWGNKFNASSKEALLEVGIKTKSKLTRKGNVPLNICFVIDKSGSMAGYDRIEQLKTSLIAFVNQLASNDIVSIVVFDHVSVVAIPAQKLGDKKKVIDIIYAIQADGGTVIFDGLVKGFDEVSKNLSAQYVNRLVLLTDGYDSSVPEEVVAKAKEYIKKGIEVSAVGVGVDYNQPLLAQLASAGGGLLHFAGDSKGIEKAFQQEMESVLYPMAKQAELELLYNDQLIYKQLYGYENAKVTKGNMKVGINHLFPGLNQLALVKFDLINATKEIEGKPVKVRLKYTDVVTSKPVVIEKTVALEWTEATGLLDMTIDKEHKKMLAVAIVNQSLKVMANANSSGNMKAAEDAVNSAMNQLNKLFPGAKPAELTALIDRMKEYVKVFEDLKKLKNHH